MKKYMHHIVALAILTSIAVFVLTRNYVPGTTIAGWDDLHPEFDFGLALSRTFEGVWRADQGLGTVAGHSHMVEMPRIVVLWLISHFVPTEQVRFAFVALSMLFGVWGMYAFVYYISRYFGTHLPHHLTYTRSAVAVIASLIYMLHIGVIQQFILPFEMFMVQFALTPWLMLGALSYVTSRNTIHLLIFACITFFYSSTAYAATLWYVFFGMFLLWAFGYVRKRTIRPFLILFIVFLAMNLYWLGPNIYFAMQRGHEVQTSKINTIFSPDIFAANKQFGNPADALLLKGFLFDWKVYDHQSQEHVQIMQAWRDHLQNPWVRTLSYTLSLIALLGIILSLVLRNRIVASFAVFFLVPLMMLLNGMWPISGWYETLSHHIPLAKEALRTPFTKVSIPAVFGIALFFAYVLSFICRLSKWMRCGLLVLFAIAILWVGCPAFYGGYIHKSVQIRIPIEYKDVFTYFRSQPPHARVALFPLHTFWNWTHYAWGYQGAGFLQFGIPQPILDRDYDRWSKYNEQYNREMSYALYAQNSLILAHTLNKYNVDYILVDTSVFEPSLPSQHSLLHWLMPEYIAQTQLFEEPVQFGDHILIYKRRMQLSPQVSLVPDAIEFAASTAQSPMDAQYISVGNYYTNVSHDTTDSTQSQIERSPNYVNSEWRADFSRDNWGICAEVHDGQSKRVRENNRVLYEAYDTNLCETVEFIEVDHAKAYELSITHENLEGRPIMICLKNLLTGHCDVNEQLTSGSQKRTDRFAVQPLWDYGFGYQLELTTIARGRGVSRNNLYDVVLREVEKEIVIRDVSDNNIQIEYEDTSRYWKEVKVQTNMKKLEPQLLVLNQAYSPGWIGLSVQSLKFKVHGFEMYLPTLVLLPHVKVNGWANGWSIDSTEYKVQGTEHKELSAQHPAEISKSKKQSNLSTMNHAPSTKSYAPSTKVLLLFWPQYLQYVGFGILLLTMGVLIGIRTVNLIKVR
ncbi:MAG TPA: hypothetical protein PKG71_00610 [Candidatus Woesebacteria bacterium]|nr:hypothetical protein [Candidatus Woesebacteria bacterium]HNS94457.1 hypothetical protein [Candidatus Woesebacteria bacterium]